jgi:hypothetical protein
MLLVIGHLGLRLGSRFPWLSANSRTATGVFSCRKVVRALINRIVGALALIASQIQHQSHLELSSR